MVVSWFSSGIDSFVATYLVKDKVDKIIYIHVEDQHEDTMRFVKDCEKFFDKEIEILMSPYKSVDNVIQQFNFIKSAYGAKCTSILKTRVRKEWEHSNPGRHTYIWGFDVTEKHRISRMLEGYPEYDHLFPLMDNQLTKQECHGITKRLGIKRQKFYDMGYSNGNCVGCIKGGMGYWNRIRVDFPDVFALRAKREREIGHSCLRETVLIDGEKVTVPLFLDELDPERGRFEDEIMEDCNIFCQLNLTE